MYNNSKEIFKNVEEKIYNKELTNEEELVNYLADLKNRGIVTQAQVNSNLKELTALVNEQNPEKYNGRMATRTPQRKDLETTSAGFGKVGFIVLNVFSVSLLAAMIALLNK